MKTNLLTVPANLSEPEIFKKMLVTSFVFHVILFLAFAFKTLILPNESLTLDPAIRVDLVALPDKVAKLPPPPTPAKPQEKAIESKIKKNEPIVLHPKHEVKESAIDKIRKMQKMEQLENDVRRQEAKERAARQAKAREILLKGNSVSPGSALHGLAKAEFNEYLVQIHQKVKENWNLPEWLQNEKLKATVIVYMDYRGVVIRRLLEKSSGDSRFDDYVIKAVDDSSPFPAPPSKFVDLVRVDGIVLGFPQ